MRFINKLFERCLDLYLCPRTQIPNPDQAHGAPLPCAQVPAYARFINERFERCLDLYLCPRTRRKRVFVPDAKALVPKLPRPRDLQPFPTQLALRYLGHTGPVRALDHRHG